MVFAVQTDSGTGLGTETLLMREQMRSSGGLYTEKPLSLGELRNIGKTEAAAARARGMLPFGTVEFVQEFFSEVYGVPCIYPVEVPVCLRTPEFLGRRYSVVRGCDVPRAGTWFVKNAGKLKDFSYCGDMQSAPGLLPETAAVTDGGLYAVSEPVEVLAEYRVYVYGGKIQGIAQYSGDPLVFPDAALIRKAVSLYGALPYSGRKYGTEEYCPGGYTMDFMVTPGGTCILEVHVLFACGLYTQILGGGLPEGYREAGDFVLLHQAPCIPDSEIPRR